MQYEYRENIVQICSMCTQQIICSIATSISAKRLIVLISIPCIGEAIGEIPKVTHVVEESHLVHLLHFLPHQGKDPEDDDALYRRWEGAPLQVGQQVDVKDVTEELELRNLALMDFFTQQPCPLGPLIRPSLKLVTAKPQHNQ